MLQSFVIRKILGPMNEMVYRHSGGRLIGKMSGMPVLLLMTTGRKSGKARSTPLTYVEDGDAYVVIASFAGQPNHPAWYLNLEANPSATVRIGRKNYAVRAETLRDSERERLWKKVTDVYQGYNGYQLKTTREIPVALRPAAST